MVEKLIIKESTPEAIFMLNDAGIVTSCNETARDLFGWPLDAIEGKLFSDIFLPNDTRKQFKDSLQNFGKAENKGLMVKGTEQYIFHRDGHDIYTKVSICRVDNNPRGCSFILSARDISEKKQQIHFLKQASRNQEAINTILQISFGDLSLEEILNHALMYALSLSTPKSTGKGAVFLVEDNSDHLILKSQVGFDDKHIKTCYRIPFGTCHCGRAALTGEIQFSNCVNAQHDLLPYNMTPHGHYCIPICSGKNILGVMSLYLQNDHIENDDEKEVLLGVCKILARIVERKKNEIQRHLHIKKQEAITSKIFEEKKLTESIIQSINYGLMFFDLEGKVLALNPTGKQILSQFINVTTSDSHFLNKFADITAVKAMYEIRPIPPNNTAEVRQLNKKGEERVLEYSIVPEENASGLKVGLILLFKDITNTLQIQKEMEKMNRLSTVAEIASAVAHEVRNPLAGIKTMSQAIEENCADNDENKEYIVRIIKQVDRLNNLLTQFFTYARPAKAKKERVSIASIVNEISQLLKIKLDSKRIELGEDYADGLPDIYVDLDQMEQVILNLMLNAIDAIKENGKIEITARLANQVTRATYADLFPNLKKNIDYVALCFKDNGKGMTSKVAAKAFDPFFTTKHQGSGLGLAIVQRILNENNAFIMIESARKKGVTFVMMFESVS